MIVKSLSDVNLKLIDLGTHLSKLKGSSKEGDLASALQALQSAFPDLPSADTVASATATELPPTIEEFMELFDTPSDLNLESENVWPAPPMLAL